MKQSDTQRLDDLAAEMSALRTLMNTRLNAQAALIAEIRSARVTPSGGVVTEFPVQEDLIRLWMHVNELMTAVAVMEKGHVELCAEVADVQERVNYHIQSLESVLEHRSARVTPAEARESEPVDLGQLEPFVPELDPCENCGHWRCEHGDDGKGECECGNCSSFRKVAPPAPEPASEPAPTVASDPRQLIVDYLMRYFAISSNFSKPAVQIMAAQIVGIVRKASS